MKIILKPKALEALHAIALFVESNNTPGSGERYLEKFLASVKLHAVEGLSPALCKNSLLASKGYSCLFVEKWVVSYKLSGSTLMVYRIIWGPILN